MKPTIFFRFEHLVTNIKQFTLRDCISIDRRNIGNFMMTQQQGFRFSQVLDSMLYYYDNVSNDDTVQFEHISSKNKSGYIIPVAVQYHPDDWSDVTNNKHDTSKQSIFELINPVYLRDMQKGKALLLIDQSVEGYSTSWLWGWFHQKCEQHRLNPGSIVYLTGDQSSADTYNAWCAEHNVVDKLKVIPSISLSMYINKHYHKHSLNTRFAELLTYKEDNADILHLYDCTNMRPRPQRVLNYLHLINANLLDKGHVTMPPLKEWRAHISLASSGYLNTYHLPNNVLERVDHSIAFKPPDGDYYVYVERILHDMYKNSWVSIITESSYFGQECSVFISEKTFKPIACMQPFIIVGSKHSLKYLRKLGYKTFSPFIDESYDELEDTERFLAVIDAIKKIEQVEDKASWYRSMKEIVEHNFNLFMQIGHVKSIEHQELTKYYFDYFKEYHV